MRKMLKITTIVSFLMSTVQSFECVDDTAYAQAKIINPWVESGTEQVSLYKKNKKIGHATIYYDGDGYGMYNVNVDEPYKVVHTRYSMLDKPTDTLIQIMPSHCQEDCKEFYMIVEVDVKCAV